MIAGLLPDEMMNELTAAWTQGNRERAEEIMEDVFDFAQSDWKTKELIDYLFRSPDELSVILESAGIESLPDAIEDYVTESFIDASDAVGGFASCLLNDFAMSPETIDCELVSRAMMYRVRAIEAEKEKQSIALEEFLAVSAIRELAAEHGI